MCPHQQKKKKKNSVKILYLPDLFILFTLRVLVSYKLNFYILTCSENLNIIISHVHFSRNVSYFKT